MAFGVFNLSWIVAGIAAPLLAGFMAQFINLYMPFILAVSISMAGLFASYLIKERDLSKKDEIGEDDVARSASESHVGLRRVVVIFGITNILNGLLNGFVNPILKRHVAIQIGSSAS